MPTNQMSARVAGTEVCVFHGGKNDFTTVEIDFYHHGNWFLSPSSFYFIYFFFTVEVQSIKWSDTKDVEYMQGSWIYTVGSM